MVLSLRSCSLLKMAEDPSDLSSKNEDKPITQFPNYPLQYGHDKPESLSRKNQFA
jgi:hypothetical protein